MGNSTPIPDPNPIQNPVPKKWSLFGSGRPQTPWAWIILPWIFLAVLVTLFLTGKLSLSPKEDKETILITRIESMGKLELVKYHLKEIVEHKMTRQWLPDPSALLLVGGEAVGCIDLSHLEKKNIEIHGDSLRIQLPKPEVCYVKINHKESRVYSTQYAFWDEAALVDDAYKDAEKQLEASVIKSDILDQTRNNAKIVLNPIFQALGYKSVTILF